MVLAHKLDDVLYQSLLTLPNQHRKNRKEFLQFLRIAYGSSAELETQIIIAKDLYSSLDFNPCAVLLEEVKKMLNGLIKKLEQ